MIYKNTPNQSLFLTRPSFLSKIQSFNIFVFLLEFLKHVCLLGNKGTMDLKQVLEFDLEGGVCLRPREWLHAAQGNYPERMREGWRQRTWAHREPDVYPFMVSVRQPTSILLKSSEPHVSNSSCVTMSVADHGQCVQGGSIQTPSQPLLLATNLSKCVPATSLS